MQEDPARMIPTSRHPRKTRVDRFSAASLLAATFLVACAGCTHGQVREPILAGSWYPEDPGELRTDVENYLGSEKTDLGKTNPAALIVPHAGYRFSGETAGRGFTCVRGSAYERVVLIGPSHQLGFRGAALPVNSAWRTPLGTVPLDQDAVEMLAGKPAFQKLPAAHAKEHCLEIELPFLQVALRPGFKIVPIVIGRLDEASCASVGTAIEGLMGPKCLLVVSSDFTHYGPNYGYVPFRDDIPQRLYDLDHEAISAIGKLSPSEFDDYLSRTEATICGAEPIRVLLSILGAKPIRASTLGYARSGDLMGDFTNSVSYVAMAFAQMEDGAGGGSEGGTSEGSGEDRNRSGSSQPRDAGAGQRNDGKDGKSRQGASGSQGPRMLTEKEQAFLLKLARETIGAALRGSDPPPARVPDEFGKESPLSEERGVFVTLTESGDLRGCIGNIIGMEPLAIGVAHQAINAAFHDPRFPQLSPDEFSEIEIEISVLTPPVPVPTYEAIEVGRHGVLLEKGGRHAVFLPQVAPEQGWDRDTMLRHLCRKAGLGSEEWRSGAQFEVFEAQVFEEKHPH